MIRFEEDLHQRLALVSAQLDQQLQWREDLLAMLVHDMRSPLQVLSSTFSLLDMEGLLGPQERQELLRSAQKNANTLAEMVQMILDTNQLDRGELSLQMRPFQIGPWAKAIMENIHPLADAKGVILGLDISPQVSVLWADEGLLQRVVLNLLNNALKFTGKDGKVRLMIDPSLKSGHVELRVRDTGIGIRNEFLPRIFDRYTQVDKRDRRGAGLGLYFCRLVVEAHGGTIRAFSQSGAGTTMTVDLPLRPPFSITGMD
jgi:signal transduction histidine kinase